MRISCSIRPRIIDSFFPHLKTQWIDECDHEKQSKLLQLLFTSLYTLLISENRVRIITHLGRSQHKHTLCFAILNMFHVLECQDVTTLSKVKKVSVFWQSHTCLPQSCIFGNKNHQNPEQSIIFWNASANISSHL